MLRVHSRERYYDMRNYILNSVKFQYYSRAQNVNTAHIQGCYANRHMQ